MDTKRAYYDIKETPTWYVDKIPAFCINLERRIDRWQQFSAQPGVQQLQNVKRFIGVDGSKLDIMNDTRIPIYIKKNIMTKTRRTHEELSTAGGIGCALSHISVWEWIVQNQAPITMIMEDDAKVPANFVPYMNQTIENSPTLKDTSKWELMTLTHLKSTMKPIPGDPLVASLDGFVGFQCYFITLDCAKRFLNEANILHLHIDLWTAVFKRVHGLQLICPTTFAVRQRNSKTDIQELNGCKICDLSSNYYKTHDLVRKEEIWLMRSVEIALGAVFLYAGYQFIINRRK
jgi:GR25 family glycosyltransferase involved in LPS biosynthesis